jgi:hypothetical protein
MEEPRMTSKPRVLISEISELIGESPEHIQSSYSTELDWANRPTVSDDDAADAYAAGTRRLAQQERMSLAWAIYSSEYPRRRDAAGKAGAEAAVAAVPGLQGAQFFVVSREGYEAGVADFDRREPFPGSGAPGAPRDVYDWYGRQP